MEFVHVELKRDTWVYPKMEINKPEDAVNAVKKLIKNLDREYVVCIHIATSGQVINASVCAIGTINTACISPTEILRTAILSGAHRIILLHNHPSGRADPSEEDILFAKKLSMASQILNLKLLDFIIVGDTMYSFRTEKKEWLYTSKEWMSVENLAVKGE